MLTHPKKQVIPYVLGAVILTTATTPSAANDNNPQPPIPPNDVARIVRTTAAKHGIDPNAFAKLAWIESRNQQYAYNRVSGAAGTFQFIASTARRYGLINRYDVKASAEAAVRLLQDNRRFLLAHGIKATFGNLYLAHQQGAAGAVRLLLEPSKRARDIVGHRAVILNGGTADMTAGEFARRWTSKFD